GPLGSFGARTKLVYALGLIGATARRDLDLVRRIRNEFAHLSDAHRFSDPSVRDRCREFHALTAYQLGSGLPVRSPRQRFLLTTFCLAVYLFAMAKRPREAMEPRPLTQEIDEYGLFVRRFSKSLTLGMLAERFAERRSIEEGA